MLIATTIDNTKHQKKIISALYMDVKEAFDNVDLKRLINMLIEKDLPLPLQ